MNFDLYFLTDIKHIYDKNPNQIEEKIIASGTSTFNLNSYIEMKVFNQNDSVIRQTKEYYIYQSGKSKSCLFTAFVSGLILVPLPPAKIIPFFIINCNFSSAVTDLIFRRRNIQLNL